MHEALTFLFFVLTNISFAGIAKWHDALALPLLNHFHETSMQCHHYFGGGPCVTCTKASGRSHLAKAAWIWATVSFT